MLVGSQLPQQGKVVSNIVETLVAIMCFKDFLFFLSVQIIFCLEVFISKMTFRPSIICMVVLYNIECYAII